MASSTLRSGTEAETGGSVLPIDAIYEILIRLPSEELCRLRVVCRPWRSLLSNPQFIAAHATRHRRPLFVAGHGKSYRADGILCRIIDLSGRVIKYIRWTSREDERLMLISTQHNLACFAKGNSMRCQLLNLVTGDRFALPEELSQEHATETRLLEILFYRVSIAFGQVASTGELKLIRVIDDNSIYHYRFPSGHQLCEVLTLGGSRDARWRGKKAAQDRVDMRPLSRAVVDGVVYFLLDEYVSNQDVQPQGIASFDLLTEEWRSIRRGPISIPAYYSNLSLAALNGSLVLVDCTSHVSMDLWFLMDFEKGLWVKQHTVQVNLSVRDEFRAHPLVILKNGSVVIYIGSRRLLRIYNPRNNTYTHVAEMVSSDRIGLYTGNLLSIANDAI
ncbi:F-box protein At3g07870-like [Miscanthus floridulus]|uniref:F-box protein At3g07870-like n=1 Tax=Miscanthus floridulus TaxID=154761 RepID=UPI00345A5C83